MDKKKLIQIIQEIKLADYLKQDKNYFLASTNL